MTTDCYSEYTHKEMQQPGERWDDDYHTWAKTGYYFLILEATKNTKGIRVKR